jgi:hypothetical protein
MTKSIIVGINGSARGEGDARLLTARPTRVAQKDRKGRKPLTAELARG